MEAPNDVFLVHHSHCIDKEYDYDDVKLIGVYATQELAQQAVERAQKLSGFRKTPDGFSIDRYELNKDHWTAGYVTAFINTETGATRWSNDD